MESNDSRPQHALHLGRIPVRDYRRAVVGTATVVTLIALMTVPPPARSGHGTFPVSAGIYRIPYDFGTQLAVTRDHHNHGGGPGLNNQGNNRIDMVAAAPPANVVAAAFGTVMAIVDIHGNSNGNGDGLDINGQAGQILFDGVTVHTDALEHSCRDGEDVNGNNILDPGEDLNGNGTLETIPNSTVIGLCQQYNNYVWIQHPNGEWSKYTHFATGSVTGPPGNLSVGDTVQAGQVLGVEADVGRAGGRHLHTEIAIRTNPTDPTPFANASFVPGAIPGGGNFDQTGTVLGYYAGGFIQGTNLVPIVCDIPNNLYVDGSTSPGNNNFTAFPCNHLPPTADAGGPYFLDEGSTLMLDGTMSNDPEGNPLTYLWSPGTNLDLPSLAQPTYTGIDDSFEILVLEVFDQIEALRAVDITIVTVNNVAPTVDVGPDVTLTSGDTHQLLAQFSDPGVLDAPWLYEIDWGDGDTTDGSTASQAGAANPLVADHMYCGVGTFALSVSVTDKDGGLGTDTKQVTVLPQSILIEIKPPSDTNPINLASKGMISVVILSSESFDATTVDPATILLGDGNGPGAPVAQRPNGSGFASLEDVNGDGLVDLVLKFRTQDLVTSGSVDPTTTALTLQGVLTDACTSVQGTDQVHVVP